MDLTDYVSTISSVASLLVAGLATCIAWTVHRWNRKIKIQELAHVERRQANLVSAWEEGIVLPTEQIADLPWGLLEEEQLPLYGNGVFVKRFNLYLANNSDLPVYDLIVHPEGLTISQNFPLLPPGKQSLETPRFTVVNYYEREFGSSECLLNISFRDAAGIRWVRQADGRLLKVANDSEHDNAMGAGYKELQQSLQKSQSL